MTELRDLSYPDIVQAIAQALSIDPKLWEKDLEFRYKDGSWTIRTYQPEEPSCLNP